MTDTVWLSVAPMKSELTAWFTMEDRAAPAAAREDNAMVQLRRHPRCTGRPGPLGDERVETGFFASPRLGAALHKAGLAKVFHLLRCRVV